MKTILIIEDRPSRLTQHFSNGEDDLSTIKSISGISMPEKENCKKIINQINDAVYDVIDNLVIIHQSALSTKGLDHLNSECIKKDVSLILFSGGSSQTFFDSEPFILLSTNAGDLYSSRFIPFLQRYVKGESESILEVINSNWKISYWMLLRQLIDTVKLEENEDRLLEFKRRISSIENLLNFDSSKGIDGINLQIKKLILT